MYRKALYSVSAGELFHATEESDGIITVITREDGRIIKRMFNRTGGKVFGARAVSYADSYFTYPFGTAEVLGEEIIFAASVNTN